MLPRGGGAVGRGHAPGGLFGRRRRLALSRARRARRGPRPDGEAIITQAAERTGGELHKQSRFFRGSSIARAFKTIFDDFRQSYVLRYSPHDVSTTGWHPIAVQVPKVKDATIRARQGYYAG